MKGTKRGNELVAGDRLWTGEDSDGLPIHKVWRGKAIDIFSDTFEEKEAVFYTFGSTPLQTWTWPNSQVEVVV
ncbi:hypothetical protein SEA_ACOLYTE_71 [Mycobacterium phage Acolyte]|nr:hypothetical protein SEA_ACOLYTE_71 [Mycobacterium phage Acolyte]